MSHSGFWNALLPMQEQYIRTYNSRLRRFGHAVVSEVPAEQRAVVNELGFLIFVSAMESRTQPHLLPAGVVKERAEEALGYVARMAHHSGAPPAHPRHVGVREATALATSLFSYFVGGDVGRVVTKPLFSGCGWLDHAEGDVLAGTMLYEIKAGERQFRSLDLRQLLCYCALNFSAKTYDIQSVALMNPRSGTYFYDSLERMCQKIAGSSAGDILGEIV